MTTGTIIPWFVDWESIYKIDNGGPVSTMLAERILAKHRDAGALGVRAGCVPATWLRPIFREMGVPLIAGLVWNSVFKTDPEHAQKRWLDWVEAHLDKWHHDVAYVERSQAGTKDHPDTIIKVRQIVNKIVGRHVPIYTYCGKYHFPRYSGTAPCPHFNDIWSARKHPEPEGMSPVERMYWFRSNHESPAWFDVAYGYPWMMPFVAGGGFSLSNMVPMEDWASVVTELRHLKVKGISIYPSPYGYARETGPLDSPIDHALLDCMSVAHTILKVAGGR